MEVWIGGYQFRFHALLTRTLCLAYMFVCVAEQEDFVQNLLQAGGDEDVITRTASGNVKRSDLQRIAGRNWLNDEVRVMVTGTSCELYDSATSKPLLLWPL